jgi:methyl-accepting chemotaxis protein
MGLLGLHHHPLRRARQLRWALPIVGLVLVAGLATLLVQYWVGNQDIGTEFFRAHKTISNTSELLRRGTLIGGVVLIVVVLALALWVLRVTHRIVRPVHTLHRALDELVAGDLGIRVELHRADEFREVGDALNRLVDEFAGTLAKVHDLVDRIVALAARDEGSPGPSTAGQIRGLVTELDRTMEFFRLQPQRMIREDAN